MPMVCGAESADADKRRAETGLLRGREGRDPSPKRERAEADARPNRERVFRRRSEPEGRGRNPRSTRPPMRLPIRSGVGPDIDGQTRPEYAHSLIQSGVGGGTPNSVSMVERSRDPPARRHCCFGGLRRRRAGALGRVASIINTDRKVATHKLALIRALCDIAMMSWASAAWESGGVVSVPLAMVAERWVRYYWPLMRAGSGGGERGREEAERGRGGSAIRDLPADQRRGQGAGSRSPSDPPSLSWWMSVVHWEASRLSAGCR